MSENQRVLTKAEIRAEAKRQKEAAQYEKRKKAHSAMMKQAMTETVMIEQVIISSQGKLK